MSSIFTITQDALETKKKLTMADRGGSMEQCSVVVPGEMIASSKYWMRGHGTFIEEQSGVEQEEDESMMKVDGESSEGLIRSSLAGTVERINKLITVSPLSGR
jgi:exosome complex component RRP4